MIGYFTRRRPHTTPAAPATPTRALMAWSPRAAYHCGLMVALRATADTARAIPFDATRQRGMYRRRLRAQGFRLRIQRIGGRLAAWCERA